MNRCLNFTCRSKDKEFPDEDEAPIDILPDELMIGIFELLPIEDLVKCEEVCRRWRKVARDPTLWRRIPIVCSCQLGEISEKKLALINSHSSCIRCIKLQYILNYPIIKSMLNQCKYLVSIELIMCRIEKEFEEDIKKWTDLTKLNLKNSLLKSDKDLVIQYDQFKKLNYLGLSDFGLSTANCESLLNCNNLNHINIEKIRGLTIDFMKLLIKTKQSTLVSLRIYGGSIVDDDTLFILATCPKLEELAILRCENLSDKALVGIATFPNLKCLQLWNNTTFSESVLVKTLKSTVLVKMKSLSLSKITNVSSRTVDVISEYYKNLRFLALYQCPLIIRTDYEKQLKAKFRNIDVVLY